MSNVIRLIYFDLMLRAFVQFSKITYLDFKMPQYWLLKVEPSDFPIKKLKEVGQVTWDGVKNCQAQKYMKTMKIGDLAFYYHTEKERSVVGIARISKEYYIDKDPKFGVVDVEYVDSFANPVTLDTIKKTEELKALTILKQPRLSVSSITTEQWDRIYQLSQDE